MVHTPDFFFSRESSSIFAWRNRHCFVFLYGSCRAATWWVVVRAACCHVTFIDAWWNFTLDNEPLCKAPAAVEICRSSALWNKSSLLRLPACVATYRKLDKKVRALMHDRQDYKGWYYTPIDKSRVDAAKEAQTDWQEVRTGTRIP